MDGTAGSAALAADNPGGEGGQGEGEQQQQEQGGAGEKPWFENEGSGIDAKYHDTIRAKGWKGPDDVLESYTNVEKLVSLERGGEAERILVRPKDDAPPEEVKSFREKAGFAAPAKPEDYGFTEEQMQAAPVLNDAAKWFHEAGVPKDVASTIVERAMARDGELQSEFQARTERDLATLQQQMGDKFGDYEEAARRAARVAGWSEATLEDIERREGTAGLFKGLAAFGKTMAEAGAPGQPRTGTGQFTSSPENAKSRIETLKNDSDFNAKLLSTNPEVRKKANAEWEALHLAAYPPDEKQT